MEHVVSVTAEQRKVTRGDGQRLAVTEVRYLVGLTEGSEGADSREKTEVNQDSPVDSKVSYRTNCSSLVSPVGSSGQSHRSYIRVSLHI